MIKPGLLMLLVCSLGVPAAGQELERDHESEPVPQHDHQHTMPASSAPRWTVDTDANVIAGFNYQDRRYFDFASWESQNWVMASARRPIGRGHVTVLGMLSLEPITVGHDVYRVDDGTRFAAGGSPQLFQTGETFRGLPLMDYQHPHDFIMAAGFSYELPSDRLTYLAGADLVGSPTLGPTPFMHRESARNNPQAPLTHHLLDSTHSTPGVLRGGIRVAAWTFEASTFRGAEPDEHRYEIDQPRLDSWAGRVGWQRGSWSVQFSGGHLHQPEAFSPYDQNRLTASAAYSGTLASRPLTMTAAWGRVLEFTPYRPVSQGGLLEWDLQAMPSLTSYGRAELARKEVIGLHVHTKDMPPHPTYLSDVGALTFGLVQDLTFLNLARLGRLGIGGDLTLYAMSMDLQPIYGGSRSYHAFFRWRPAAGLRHVH